MSAAENYRYSNRGDINKDSQRQLQPLTSLSRPEYTKIRDIFGQKADPKSIARIVHRLEPHANRYREFYQAYPLNQEKEQYLHEIKEAVCKSIEKTKVRKGDVARGVAVRSLGYIFGGVITLIYPPAGISLILGTSGELTRYALIEGYRRVRTNKRIEEDLGLLATIEPEDIEAVMRDVSLYPEKVEIELAEIGKATPYQSRLKKLYQKLKLRK